MVDTRHFHCDTFAHYRRTTRRLWRDSCSYPRRYRLAWFPLFNHAKQIFFETKRQNKKGNGKEKQNKGRGEGEKTQCHVNKWHKHSPRAQSQCITARWSLVHSTQPRASEGRSPYWSCLHGSQGGSHKKIGVLAVRTGSRPPDLYRKTDLHLLTLGKIFLKHVDRVALWK